MDGGERGGRGSLALVAGGIALAGVPAQAAPPKTIEPGKLTVGINGDMPMTSVKDGKLIGTDGELIAAIAGKLGLEVNVVQMEWSALIQATKQGKVDLMLGSMGWTKERSQVMLLSDPIYYFGTFLLQKKTSSYSTFEDMKGHSVGTVTGFTLVPELKSVPGIGEVKLYDTSDGVMRDVLAGRLDMAVLDPGLVAVRDLAAPGVGHPPGGAEAAARQVPDHVHQVLLDHGHLQGAGRPRDRDQRRDRQGLGGLRERRLDVALRPGRPGLVHAAVAGLPGRRRPAGRLEVAERARELLQEVLTGWAILPRPG